MRSFANFTLFVVLGVVAGLALLVTVPRVAGFTPFTILTGSMSPAYAVGDVVLDERLKPTQVRPGDVVTFSDPSREGATVTHRVESMTVQDAQVRFVTKGDANTASETWAVPVGGSIGRVRMSVPKVGYVLQWTRSREGRLGLVVVPAALLALIELSSLLGLGRRREEAIA